MRRPNSPHLLRVDTGQLLRRMKSTRRKLCFLVRIPVKILRKSHLTSNGKMRKTIQHLVLSCMIALILLVIVLRFPEKGHFISEFANFRLANESLLASDFPIWTRISDSVYTYSAFLDMRGIGNRFNIRNVPIRIIGLWKLPPKGPILRQKPLLWYHIKDEIEISPTQYHCKVFYVNNVTGRLESFKAQTLTHKIFEEGLKVFAGTFFNCYINKSMAQILAGSSESLSVSIYPTFPSSAQQYPTKLIPVVIIPQVNAGSRGKSPPPLTLCVRPLFGPMDDLVQLRQFLRFYAAMEVSEFNFYDFGLSSPAKAELRTVAAFTGTKVTIKKWNLPTGNWEELWDYGSLAALNDCVYRNMDKRWVIVVDLDEFMVPQEEITTLQRFLTNSSNYESYSQLLARNTFFCNEFCRQSVGSDELPIFSCLIRTKRIWNVNLRSKFIVYPQHVSQVGHHGVTKFLEPTVGLAGGFLQEPMTGSRLSKSYVFPEKVLILNHYRECESISTRKNPILNRATTIDTTMLKYKHRIF